MIWSTEYFQHELMVLRNHATSRGRCYERLSSPRCEPLQHTAKFVDFDHISQETVNEAARSKFTFLVYFFAFCFCYCLFDFLSLFPGVLVSCNMKALQEYFVMTWSIMWWVDKCHGFSKMPYRGCPQCGLHRLVCMYLIASWRLACTSTNAPFLCSP